MKIYFVVVVHESMSVVSIYMYIKSIPIYLTGCASSKLCMQTIYLMKHYNDLVGIPKKKTYRERETTKPAKRLEKNDWVEKNISTNLQTKFDRCNNITQKNVREAKIKRYTKMK